MFLCFVAVDAVWCAVQIPFRTEAGGLTAESLPKTCHQQKEVALLQGDPPFQGQPASTDCLMKEYRGLAPLPLLGQSEELWDSSSRAP